MKTPREQAKFLRLVNVADKAQGLSALLQHEEVQSFFAEYERRCIEKLVEADPNDDDARRAAGLRLQAMRTLMDDMTRRIETGRRAAEKIEGITYE